MNQLSALGDFIASDYLRALQSVLVSVFLALGIYYLINIGNQHIERSRRININLKIITRVVALVVLALIARYVFGRFPIIGSTIYALVISAILTYVISPAVDYLSDKGIPKQVSVVIVYLAIILTFTVLMIVVVPRTLTELSRLFSTFPDIAGQVSDWFTDFASQVSTTTGINLQLVIDSVEAQFVSLMNVLEGEMAGWIRDLATGLYSVIESLVSFVLILVFTFFFSVEKSQIKEAAQRNLPSKHRKDILYLAREIDRVLSEFVKGRLLMAFFVGLMTMVMLLILRVDFAVVIGLLTMIADIIPYIGPFIAFIPAFIFALLDSWVKAAWVGVLFVFLQWVENNVLGPKILGERTGLHPMIILICIIVGGGMYGVLGMILSVPIFSVALVVKDFVLIKLAQREELDKDLRL